MSDFSEVYGLLFTGLAIVLLFLACYKIIIRHDELINNQLSSDYLASKFKSDLPDFDYSNNYSKTFVFPRYDAFSNRIYEAVVYE